MDWSEDSAKALVVIGDCCPHAQSYTDQHINWHDELDILKGMGIKVSHSTQLLNHTLGVVAEWSKVLTAVPWPFMV